MATSYTGLRVQDTYNAIIKIGDNSNLSATPKLLSDGLGNDSPLYLSGTRLGIGISPAYQFHTSGNAKIGGNLIVSGNLTVNGTLTYLNVEDLAVEDPIIKLAKDNTANTLDIGLFGKYVATGTKYKGFFNDASDDKFKLFIGTTVEPTTTVDTSASGYTVGTLVANLEGNVTGNADTATGVLITADSADTSRRMVFTESSNATDTDGRLFKDSASNFFYNPSTNILTVGSVNATSNVVVGGTINSGRITITDSAIPIIFNESGHTGSGQWWRQVLDGGNIRFDVSLTGDSVFTTYKAVLELNNDGSITAGGQVTIPQTPTADGHAASKKYVDDQIADVDTAKRLEVTVKNVSGAELAKGVVVHASPTATPPSGNVIEVIAADANDAAKMPSIGVLNETIADQAEGEAVMFGTVQGIDTSGFSIGDELYVSTTAGELTATKPTANDELVQKVAIVIKSHESNGLIKVFGAGRANDVPNQIDRNVNFTDNSKLTFGDSTSPDFKIYHEGTDSIIQNYTGSIYIDNNADDQDIVFRSDDGSGGLATYFQLDGSSQINIFYQHTRTIDNKYLGAGSSLDVYMLHDGTNSFIRNGTGDLTIEQQVNDKDIIFKSDNGSGGVATYYYLDGSEQLNRFLKNILIPDNVHLSLGNSFDLKIYHDGSDSWVRDTNTGNLYIDTNGTHISLITDGTSSTPMARFYKDAAVELYYNNTKKFETTSTGVTVTGNVTGSQAIFSSSTAPVIQSTSSSTAENILLIGTDTSAASAPDLVLYRNAGATADNDTLGVVEFRGRNDANTGVKSYSGIYSRIIDASENEGALTFSVNSGSNYVNAMAIHNTGTNQPKVIIGNTDAFAVPTHTLDVDGTLHVSGDATLGGDITTSGIIKTSDGTATTPAYNFSSHDGNGMYLEEYDATNNKEQVSISTDGVRRFRANEAGIWSDQNVYFAGNLRKFGEWLATSGTAGYGFKFQNTADSTTPLFLSSSGDATFAGSIQLEGPDGGLVFRNWTANSGYASIATNNMTGTEYVLVTDGTNTFLSGGGTGYVVIRGGTNNSDHQLQIGTTYAKFFGNLQVDGTINGNVTGNLTGNVTGNLTGNVTGNVTGNAYLNTIAYQGGEGTELDNSDFNVDGIGTTFRWIESNSSSTGSTWKKVADIVLNSGFFAGVQMEVKVLQPNTNWGNNASLNTVYYSIAFRGEQSDTGPFYNDALVYGIDANLIRVYKTSDDNYELQARSNDDNRDLVVECNITSKNKAKVTPTTTYTDGTITGGTAYTASPNNLNKTKFAGDVEFEGAVFDDAEVEDLRVNEYLYLGSGATSGYGPHIKHSDSGGTGQGMAITVESNLEVWGVTGNAGEQNQGLYVAGGVAKLYDMNGVVLETVLGGVDITGDLDVSGTITGDVTGDLTGNVTGNVTGDLTGNVTGDVTGDLTGSVTGAASLNVLKAGDTMTGNLTLSGGRTLFIPTHTGTEIDLTGSNAGNIRANSSLYLLSQTSTVFIGANGTNGILSIQSDKVHSDQTIIIECDLDQILTLDQTGGGWSYIGFASDGTRNFYVGQDSNEDFVIGADASSEFIFNGFSGILFAGATLNNTGNITPNTDSTYNIGTSAERYANIYADNIHGSSQSLSITSNDTFSGTYSLLWHSGETVYSSSFMTINGSTDTFNVTNISTGNLNTSGNIFVGDSNNTDNYIKVYHSDDHYSELHGYGILTDRVNYYIRPVNDGTQTLYLGAADATLDWSTIQLQFSSSAYFYRNGTLKLKVDDAYTIVYNKLLVNQSSNLTSKALQVNGFIDITNVGSTALRWYDGSTFRGGLGTNQWALNGSAADLSMYVSGDNSFFTIINNSISTETYSEGLKILTATSKLVIDGSNYSGLNVYSPSNAHLNVDARDFGSDGAALHKYNRNNLDNAYRAYYERWYDGSNYYNIGAEGGKFKVTTTLATSGSFEADGDIYVVGSGYFGSSYRTRVSGSSAGAFIEFGTSSDSNSLGTLGTLASCMLFNTTQSLGHKWQVSGQTKMRLTTGGDLSVGGDFAPSYTLHVDGHVRADQIILENYRVSGSQEYPVGHYTGGKEVWSFDTTWSNLQLQQYFKNNNVEWYEDTTAPGGWAIAITGGVYVGGAYSSGFPYIPVDDDAIYYMECYIRSWDGTQRHYMGSIDYNESFTSLGGNPGSFGYWVMSNTQTSTTWQKVSGYITGFGTAVGTFKSGTKYWTPQALFNYGQVSGTRKCVISGWRVIRMDKQEFFSSGLAATPSISFAKDQNSGMYSPGNDKLGLTVGGSRKIYIESGGVRIQNGTLSVVSNNKIQTLNGTTYLNLIYQNTTNNNLEIGQDSTTLINDVQIKPGVSGMVKLLGSQSGTKLNVDTAFNNAKIEAYDSGVCRIRLTSGANDVGMTLAESGSDKWNIFSASGTLHFRDTNQTTSKVELESDGDLILRGGRIVVRETDNGNDAVEISSDASKGFLTVKNGGTNYVSFRGDADNFIRTDSTSEPFFRWYYGISQVGSIVTNMYSTIYNTTSDYRLKENVTDITNALDRIDNLKPKRFNFKTYNQTVDGFIAHEVADVVPEAVVGEKDAIDENGNPEYQGIDQSKLVPLLVASIKELRAEVNLLKSKINS